MKVSVTHRHLDLALSACIDEVDVSKVCVMAQAIKEQDATFVSCGPVSVDFRDDEGNLYKRFLDEKAISIVDTFDRSHYDKVRAMLPCEVELMPCT